MLRHGIANRAVKSTRNIHLVLYFSVLAYVSLPMFPGIFEYGSQNMRIIKDAKIQHPPAADGIEG
jgi:hypothetical protein